jgi:hypothetical protein
MEVLADRGPEVHLLDGLVPGFLDDELLRELLALGQLVGRGGALPDGAYLKLGEQLLHLGVVTGQEFECIRHLPVLLRWRCSLRWPRGRGVRHRVRRPRGAYQRTSLGGS